MEIPQPLCSLTTLRVIFLSLCTHNFQCSHTCPRPPTTQLWEASALAEHPESLKLLKEQSRCYHWHDKHAGRDTQNFATELQVLSIADFISSSTTVIRLLSLVTSPFLCSKQLGYLCYLPIPHCGFPSTTSAPKTSALQVHPGQPVATATTTFWQTSSSSGALTPLSPQALTGVSWRSFWHPVGSKLSAHQATSITAP